MEPKTRALFQAVGEGNLHQAKLLIKKGASAHILDYDQRSCLHVAAASGHLQMAQFFVHKQHCEVYCFDRFGRTPLQDAVDNGQ